MTENLTFRSTDGLSIQGALDAPERPVAVLVLCHPHPKMGGTMNAPLLLAVRDELAGRSWAVLRFNFRGIGTSEGESSLGIDEVADARGALAEARARFPGLPVALAGWSFGASVAIRAAAEDQDVVALVAIAPAIAERPGITAGAPDPSELDLHVPVLVIVGLNDDLVSPEDCRAWVSKVASASILELKGANHFFWGRYETLAGAVAGFLEESLPG